MLSNLLTFLGFGTEFFSCLLEISVLILGLFDATGSRVVEEGLFIRRGIRETKLSFDFLFLLLFILLEERAVNENIFRRISGTLVMGSLKTSVIGEGGSAFAPAGDPDEVEYLLDSPTVPMEVHC